MCVAYFCLQTTPWVLLLSTFTPPVFQAFFATRLPLDTQRRFDCFHSRTHTHTFSRAPGLWNSLFVDQTAHQRTHHSTTTTTTVPWVALDIFFTHFSCSRLLFPLSLGLPAASASKSAFAVRFHMTLAGSRYCYRAMHSHTHTHTYTLIRQTATLARSCCCCCCC